MIKLPAPLMYSSQKVQQAIVLGICLFAYLTAHAQQAPILAAASSLRTLWPALMDAYIEETGMPEPKVSFGSSGLLSTQIINGAPFDIFLSADQQSVNRIAQERFSEPPTIFALGTLQLAVLADSQLADKLSIHSIAQTLSATQQSETDATTALTAFRVAIPNPVHAPYGKAAQEVLDHASMWPLPDGSLVSAENAAQTLQFLKTGAVSAALLPSALIGEHSPDLVTAELPAFSYERIEHVLVVLSAENTQAAEFGRWLSDANAQSVLREFGLQVDSH